MIQFKTLKTLLSVIGAALTALALMAPVANAAEEPAEGFQQFAGCPSPEQEEEVFWCISSEVTGGHFQMGSKDVPIKNPITLVGGLDPEFENFKNNSKGGLSKAKQEIPGGLVGLTGLDWLVNFLGLEALKVYAVTELTGPPTGFSFETVTLPLKVHLINPVLGNNCYIGTNSNPIVLNNTVNTTSPPPPNEPITGVVPQFSEAGGIAFMKDGTFVENEFAAPGASGCVLTLLGFIPINLNPLVNFQSGLPSPAGTNESVQDFDLELTLQETVYP